MRVHALVPLGVTLSVIRKPFCESTYFGENGILPCCVRLLYIRALFRGDLKAWVGACLRNGSGSEAVSSFERRAIYRRIEGCVMRECDSRKKILHVFVLRVVTFCEAAIKVQYVLCIPGAEYFARRLLF